RDQKPDNILLRRKSESRNPKSETNPKPETANPKPGGFAVSDLGNSDLGFVSGFGFRISDFDPKIADFGLAKRLDVDQGHTATGAVLGTPSYMAPAQGAGQTKDLGPATDVYALGAILYELLTGRPPFRAASVLDTLAQVRDHDPVPPRRLQPGTPRALEVICLKCLQKDPRKRYSGAADLGADLGRFLNGEPIQARPAGAWERAVLWARRRPAVAALAASLVAVAALGLAGVTWEGLRADAERQAAPRAP